MRDSGGSGGGSGRGTPGPYPLLLAQRYALETVMGSVVLDTSEPGVVIVILEGEHELYGAMKLQRQLRALIGEGASIVIDLARATFLDSSIVSVLLQTRREAREAQAAFSIVVSDATGEPVRRMFEITGIGSILPVVGSRKAALARAS